MNLPDLLAGELDRLRDRLGRDALAIVETGSIRNDTPAYEANDGWSTLAFARQVAEHGGVLTSIDLDTGAAARVLDRHGLAAHVNLLTGHSIDQLAALLADGYRFDVAYLDSDNDAQLILHEYLLATRLVYPGGLIMVDDVNLADHTVRKGDQVVPWLEASQAPHSIEQRHGTGYHTGVLVVSN